MTRNRVMTIGLLLILPLFVTGCGLKKNPAKKQAGTPSPTASVVAGDVSVTDETGSAATGAVSLLSVDPTSLDASIVDHKNQADAKAKAWRADAKITHVSIKVPSDFQVGQATETYTYGSVADPFNWWTVTISGKTNKIVRALIPKEDFLGTGYTAIPTQHWKINYVEALQLAEVHGGAEARKKLLSPETIVTLAVGQPKNYLWWTVEYRSAESDPYRILINPSTKEVTNEQGEPLTGQVSAETTPNASTVTTQPTANVTTTTNPNDVITEDDVLEE